MATKDHKEWKQVVEEEHACMTKNNAWVAVLMENIPKGEKIISSTWAMKKKSNGVYRARLNARGYEQVDGKHYKEDNKAAPVVNDTAFHVLLILMMMALWHAKVMERSCRAFLKMANISIWEFQRGSNSTMDPTTYCCCCALCMDSNRARTHFGNSY
jgi:hypothetical protein